MAAPKKKKNTKKKNKKKNRKKKTGARSLVWSLLRLCLVVGIWVGIGLGLLVAYYAAELPDIISDPKFDYRASVTIMDRNGQQLSRYGDLKGANLSVEDLPPHLINAVISIEDRRFYSHFGIDPLGITRAMATNILKGGVVQGGSTITQQLAKNLFLTRERRLKRKIQEALLALWLEQKLTKDEILSAYLNRVYLGSGTYGVEAASQTYFDKSARNLNLTEAATIAGLLKAPSRYSPLSNPGLSSKRTKVVLNAMADAGYITEKEASSQKLITPKPQRKPSQAKAIYYFSDWVNEQSSRLIGQSQHDLLIKTTLHAGLQSQAEAILSKYLREYGSSHDVSQGAILVMDFSGAVLAMVGGRNYDISQFNRATQAIRQPGSAFKPIVYLAAFAEEYDSEDLLDDSPLQAGSYSPENFKNEYYGAVTLEDALARSMNTATVRLAQDVGLSKIKKTARSLGITSPLASDLSLSLGSSSIGMIELATAYGTIGNDGYFIRPYTIQTVKTAEGDLLYTRPDFEAKSRIIDKGAVRSLDKLLQAVVSNGTGKAAQAPFKTAGKTGTSQDYRDAWFIGYSDRYITAVWLGNDDNSPMRGVTGGGFPARIWRDVMGYAHNLPDDDFKTTQAPENGMSGGDGFMSLLDRIFTRD